MGSVVKYDRTLFEPEHDLFRESYRAFLDRHVAPYHEQWEKDKIVDRGVWLEAGKQGFLGMAVPEEYGGGGDPDFRYNVIITEETTAGRYSGIGFGLHNDVDRAVPVAADHRRAEAAVAAAVLHRRTDHGDRNDRAGHRKRPAGHQDPRGQTGRPLRAQRCQDLHHQRHQLRPGDRGRLHRPRQGRPRLSRCWSSSVEWRASSAAASSTRSAWTPRTPRNCRSPTSRSRPRTCSARRAWASST